MARFFSWLRQYVRQSRDRIFKQTVEKIEVEPVVVKGFEGIKGLCALGEPTCLLVDDVAIWCLLRGKEAPRQVVRCAKGSRSAMAYEEASCGSAVGFRPS